jgi:hypothetical protein
MSALRPVFVKVRIASDKTGNENESKHEKPLVTGELTACAACPVEDNDFVVVPEHGIAFGFP